jgi:RimJ/RimL family protein N-acetyltransferase
MQPLIAHGLCLRPFEASDAEAFAQAVLESTGTMARWMPWCHPNYTAEEAREWFAAAAQAIADQSAVEVGIFSGDGTEPLGGVGLNQFNRLHNYCNLGFWVRESRQRQGIATRAAQLLAEFGFKELGLTRIEIVIAEGNAASNGVARKLGAHFECAARNRLVLHGTPVNASIYSLIPADRSAWIPVTAADRQQLPGK